MYLLKNLTSNFTFDKILEKSYNINEGRNTIKKVQFANGKRKRIDTDYEDCIIEIQLGGIDADDLKSYIDNLTDGSFEYFSMKYQTYKKAKFLVTIPNIIVERAYSVKNYYIDDITITLEKSDDII